MLRLLFTTEDNSHQLTVITDGIDGQLNVFVTENVVGDISYFNSLGIVIEPGHTYNIGQLKEWAYNNALVLISYPEGLNDQSTILSSIKEEYVYTFSVDPTSLSFVNTGESKAVTVTSTKQLMVNGEPEGDPEDCAFTSSLTGDGYSKNESGSTINVTVTENPGDTARNGVLTITQTDSKKSLTVNLSQAASVITYDYVLTPNPTSLSFVAAGETKAFTVTSTKQKKINGVSSGAAEPVTYTPSIAGDGFTLGSDNLSVVAAANTGALREGSVTITQSEPASGAKTATITLSQEAGATA